MNKKTIIGGIAALAVASGGGWYFASPGYAMTQLRDAAIEGNAETLEERIDFQAVRASLKEQLRAELAAKIASAKQGGGLEAFGAMLAMGMVDPMIDGLINAESMAAMIKQGKMQAPSTSEDDQATANWEIERDGFSRFSATPDASRGDKVPTLVFERDGLGWRLVEIDIPEGGLGSNAS